MAWDGMSALRKGLPFGTVSEVVLCSLLDSGKRLTVPANTTIAEANVEPDGIYLVMRGEVHRCDEDGRLIARLEIGDSFGCTEVFYKDVWTDKFVAGDTGFVELIHIPIAAVRDVMWRNFAFGRSLRFFANRVRPVVAPSGRPDQGAPSAPEGGSPPDPAAAPQMLTQRVDMQPLAELVVFRNADHAGAAGRPLGLLMECAARAIAADSRKYDMADEILVVRVVAGDSAASAPVKREGEPDFSRVGEGALGSALEGWSKQYHYIFVDNHDVSKDGALTPPARYPITTVWLRLRSTERTPSAGVGGRSISLLLPAPHQPRTVLDRLTKRGDPGESLAAEPTQEVEHTGLLVDLDVLQREARSFPSTSVSRLPSGAAFEALCRAVDAATPDAYEPTGEGLSRVGRCLTQRLLGVALGGGGALGYAHVPLLQEMRLAGLPVDLVAGTSFGAVVGAYYSAKPRFVEDPRWGPIPEGLSLLLSRTDALQLAINLCIISNVPSQLLFDRDLDFRSIHHLPVRCATVATDINVGTTAPLTRGSVGRAIAASGSAPALFAPVTTKNARYVDGGVVDNVPGNVVARMGASLVVTSNPLPPTTEWSPPPPLFPGWIGRQIYEFNLLYRGIDGIRSIYALATAFSNATAAAVAPWGRVAFQPTGLPPIFKGLFFDFSIAPKVIETARKSLEEQGTIKAIRRRWYEVMSARARTI